METLNISNNHNTLQKKKHKHTLILMKTKSSLCFKCDKRAKWSSSMKRFKKVQLNKVLAPSVVPGSLD